MQQRVAASKHCLLLHSTGDDVGQMGVLITWQEFLINSVNSWRHFSRNSRRGGGGAVSAPCCAFSCAPAKHPPALPLPKALGRNKCVKISVHPAKESWESHSAGWLSASCTYLSCLRCVLNEHHLIILMGKSARGRRWEKFLCDRELCSWRRKTTALRTKYWLNEQGEVNRYWLAFAVNRSQHTSMFFSKARWNTASATMGKRLMLHTWHSLLQRQYFPMQNPWHLQSSTDDTGSGESSAWLEQRSAAPQICTQNQSNNPLIYIN